MTLLLSLTALSVLLWRLRVRQLHRRWLARLNRPSTRVEYQGPYVHRKWTER